MKKQIILIGNGNMALAIARGLKSDYALHVVGRDTVRLEAFERAVGVAVTKHAMDGYDISGQQVILCVKPGNLESVAKQLRGKADLLYSILAGVSLATLRQAIPAEATVRAMPNLAANVGKSMTTLTGDANHEPQARALFDAIGTTLWVDSEKELDIATALAGSGPAYLAVIAEALTDGAVQQGLKRHDATVLMHGLFEGFGELVKESHPALLKDGVMSPGGTTAAGYAALEEAGVRRGLINAIAKAYERSQQLK